MTAAYEWDRWEESWRSSRASTAELEALIARTRSARRAIRVVRGLSVALALVSLAIVAAALRHAGNALEITLGVIVACGIVAVWISDARNQRHESEKVEALPDEYRATRHALCTRRIRFAQLGWLVVALDLVFLIPWWIGGLSVHGAGFHLSQILTMWLPLGVIAAFVTWTIALRRRATGELVRLGARDE